MSVNPVSSAAASHVKPATTSASSVPSAVTAAQQEATETASTTRQEAAHGDQVAIRKLARLKQQEQLRAPTAAQEPGKGERINRTA